MTEEIKTNEQTPQEAGAQPEISEKGAIPYDRFKEVVSEKNALKERLEKIEIDLKKKSEEELVSQKKFEDLYTTTKLEKERLEKSFNAIEERSSKEIEEEFKTLTQEEQAELKELLPQGLNKFEELGKIRILKSKLFKTNSQPAASDSRTVAGKTGSMDLETMINVMQNPFSSSAEKNAAKEAFAKLSK